MPAARARGILAKQRLPGSVMASWPDPEFSMVPLAGMTLHLAAAGPADGPLTILLHGFPEAWFARRQIGPLAAAGLRVLAPDLRGYNRTTRSRRGWRRSLTG
ncbi:alpha/beta fold hydrolase [Methylobacterium nonmethylotrophicum]|uniref:Alpha/beta fold hydrolase n=1 Tax=Methylobacterium nonmethylotrophicum TaxID=1141884 RepID=A0A4Z0NM59_9HYPH|nr:alpha/beta fold hydrolase [Methylobacterium nonmethylotrophicum]